MRYHSQRERCHLPHYPFKSCTVLRPIGWLSMLWRDGVVDVDGKLDIAKRQSSARMG